MNTQENQPSTTVFYPRRLYSFIMFTLLIPLITWYGFSMHQEGLWWISYPIWALSFFLLVVTILTISKKANLTIEEHGVTVHYLFRRPQSVNWHEIIEYKKRSYKGSIEYILVGKDGKEVFLRNYSISVYRNLLQAMGVPNSVINEQLSKQTKISQIILFVCTLSVLGSVNFILAESVVKENSVIQEKIYVNHGEAKQIARSYIQSDQEIQQATGGIAEIKRLNSIVLEARAHYQKVMYTYDIKGYSEDIRILISVYHYQDQPWQISRVHIQ